MFSFVVGSVTIKLLLEFWNSEVTSISADWMRLWSFLLTWKVSVFVEVFLVLKMLFICRNGFMGRFWEIWVILLFQWLFIAFANSAAIFDLVSLSNVVSVFLREESERLLDMLSMLICDRM